MVTLFLGNKGMSPRDKDLEMELKIISWWWNYGSYTYARFMYKKMGGNK